MAETAQEQVIPPVGPPLSGQDPELSDSALGQTLQATAEVLRLLALPGIDDRIYVRGWPLMQGVVTPAAIVWPGPVGVEDANNAEAQVTYRNVIALVRSSNRDAVGHLASRCAWVERVLLAFSRVQPAMQITANGAVLFRTFVSNANLQELTAWNLNWDASYLEVSYLVRLPRLEVSA